MTAWQKNFMIQKCFFWISKILEFTVFITNSTYVRILKKQISKILQKKISNNIDSIITYFYIENGTRRLLWNLLFHSALRVALISKSPLFENSKHFGHKWVCRKANFDSQKFWQSLSCPTGSTMEKVTNHSRIFCPPYLSGRNRFDTLSGKTNFWKETLVYIMSMVPIAYLNNVFGLSQLKCWIRKMICSFCMWMLYILFIFHLCQWSSDRVLPPSMGWL